MSGGIGVVALMVLSQVNIAQETILECGYNSNAGFNGWSVSPYSVFSAVEFTEHTISFEVPQGGDYTISLTRKVESMQDFERLNFEVNFDRLQNCVINAVEIFISEDGKVWKAAEMNQLNYTGHIENSTKAKYVKVSANVAFSKNGYLECSYFRMYNEEAILVDTPAPVNVEELNEFFIFCFNRSLNVETKSEDLYEVIFTNLSGQIVYRESAIGSNRIQPDIPDGVYVVSIIQDSRVIHSKKVVF